jgi:hypothetical protein
MFKAFFGTTQYLSVTNYKSTSFQSQKTSILLQLQYENLTQDTLRPDEAQLLLVTIHFSHFPSRFLRASIAKYCYGNTVCILTCVMNSTLILRGVFGYLELRRSFVSKRDNKRLQYIGHETAIYRNPHNSLDWYDRIAGQFGYKHIFCQNAVYTQKFLRFILSFGLLWICQFLLSCLMLCIDRLRHIFVSSSICKWRNFDICTFNWHY